MAPGHMVGPLPARPPVRASTRAVRAGTSGKVATATTGRISTGGALRSRITDSGGKAEEMVTGSLMTGNCSDTKRAQLDSI